MTDTTIPDAVVFPQDDGTGVPDGEEDYHSAGYLGLLAQAMGRTSFVNTGLEITDVDTANDTVDVTAGTAFITVSGTHSVQSGDQSSYDTTLPSPVTFVVALPTDVTLQLASDAESKIYLAFEEGTNDSVYVRHGPSVAEPSDPSLHLGNADSSDGSTTYYNDGPVPDLWGVQGRLTNEKFLHDLEGPGLQINNGILEATSGGSSGGTSLVTAHDVRDFGADDTGGTASDQALDDAVAAADPGDWILMTNGTFRFDADHRIEKSVVLYCEGSEFVCTYYAGDRANYNLTNGETDRAVIQFRGDLTGEATTTASSVSEDIHRVPVNDTTPFSPGDMVRVVAQGVGPLSRSWQPTVAVVEDVAGGELFLDTGLRYDTPAGSDVERIVPLERPRVIGGTWTGDEAADEYAQNVVSFNFCLNGRAERVEVDGYMCHAFQTWDSYQCSFVDCSAVDARKVIGSHGEAFRVVGSTDVHVVRPTIHLCRRAIDIRSGCKNLYVDEPDISGIVLHGLSYHGGTSDPVSGNLICRGGRIHCAANYDDTLTDRFDNPDGANTNQAGRCFDKDPGDGYIRIVGTEMIGHRNGVAELYGATNVYVSDCTMGNVDDGCRFVLKIDGDGSPGTALRHRYENVTIDRPGGGEDYAIGLQNGAADVEFNGDIRGDWNDEAVRITGDSRDVDLELSIEGPAGGQATSYGVVIDEADRVTIEDSSIRTTEPAVSFQTTGPKLGVRIRDTDIDCGAANGHAIESEQGVSATIHKVWIENVDATHGSAHDIYSDTGIDGLWIVDSVYGSLVESGGAPHEVRGNWTGQ